MAMVIVGVVLLVRWLPVEQPLSWLETRVDALGLWGAASYVVAFVLVTVLLLPGWPLTVAAGALFGPVVGTIVITVATTVSAGVSFLAARYLAHDRVARMLPQYPRLRALYRATGEDSWRVVAAVRLSHALPFGLQNLLFGLTPIRFWPYLLTSIVVMLPGTLVYVYLGHLAEVAIRAESAGTTVDNTQWWVRMVGLPIAGAAMLYVLHIARKAMVAAVSKDENTRKHLQAGELP